MYLKHLISLQVRVQMMLLAVYLTQQNLWQTHTKTDFGDTSAHAHACTHIFPLRDNCSVFTDKPSTIKMANYEKKEEKKTQKNPEITL